MIEISLAAARHFQKQLQISGKTALSLRVKRSGCSGLSYDLSLLDTLPDPEAYVWVQNELDLPFYLETQSQAYLKGLKIDFKTEGLQHRLVYINPNETGQCGCGESFSVLKIEDVTIVKRDVEGTLIPYGQSVTLIPGTEVLVTQSLGGSFTLNVNGNLVRIEGRDADAIGKEVVLLPSEKIDPNIEGVSEELVWEQLRTCFDPEIPVNIVDLGLIYELEITEQKKNEFHIGVQMTLTAPGCGMGPVLTQDIENKLLMIPHVKKVDVVLVFDPPWNSEMMSEAAKLELDLL